MWRRAHQNFLNCIIISKIISCFRGRLWDSLPHLCLFMYIFFNKRHECIKYRMWVAKARDAWRPPHILWTRPALLYTKVMILAPWSLRNINFVVINEMLVVFNQFIWWYAEGRRCVKVNVMSCYKLFDDLFIIIMSVRLEWEFMERIVRIFIFLFIEVEKYA